MAKQEETLQEILEIVTFLKDNSVTKKELQDVKTELRKEFKNEIWLSSTSLKEELRTEFKTEMSNLKHELIEHIDAFAVKQNEFKMELAALRSKTNRLEAKLS